jgi:ABC-type multidrug transport system fused ATPase/permease subunit
LRSFINFLYRQDFMGPGIELVLAGLLEAKQIMSSDIWVYTRVIEDVIDLMLTRFRLDATLATLKTNVDRMTDLSTRLANTRARGYASCQVEPSAGAIKIGGLHYSRGSSTVQLSQLVLHKGRVYAVTGPNGSGKSSLFGILASCGRARTMLPEGMKVHSAEELVLPSNNIVEITQQLYCPLFIKPVAWMLQEVNMDSISEDQLQKHIHRIMQLSSELDFRQTDSSEGSQDSAGMTDDELQTEAEDWFSTLSGGQRGKAEFIRKVFMRDSCPPILLIDEAFAPLDPRSKALVQRKLKEFCSDSVILVIYHGGASEACVPSEGFFDSSLHFGNGTASLVPVCASGSGEAHA